MRSLLIITLQFILFCYHLVAQKSTVVKISDDSLSSYQFSYYFEKYPDGEYLLYYKSTGMIGAKTYYKDSLPTGTWHIYYPGGQLCREISFIKGRVNGIIYEYYENGNPKKSAFYTDSRPKGPFLEWYPDGKLKSAILTDHENGLPIGFGYSFYDNMNVQCSSKARNSEIDPLDTGSYTLVIDTCGADIVECGFYQCYFPDGKIKSENYFPPNEKDILIVTEYNNDGTVLKKNRYRKKKGCRYNCWEKE